MVSAAAGRPGRSARPRTAAAGPETGQARSGRPPTGLRWALVVIHARQVAVGPRTLISTRPRRSDQQRLRRQPHGRWHQRCGPRVGRSRSGAWMAQRWRRWRREPISKAIQCQAGFNLGRASRNKRESLACPRRFRSAVTPILRGVSVCIPLKIATHFFEAISWLREPGALDARSRLLEAG